MKKILVTLGPSSMNEEAIKKMTELGVALFRINLSHTPLNKIEKYINIVKSNSPVPVCLDSEGAQMRNHRMKNGTVYFEANSIIKIYYDEVVGDSNNISFTPLGIAHFFEVNDILRIDFDLATIQVIEKNKNHCLAKVIKEGVVGSCKAVDINKEIPLPSITEKDKKAIDIGKQIGIKHYALSFANTKDEVVSFKNLVGKESNIISKIESSSGLKNLEAILAETDEILIDRGDLSRQVSIEKIPFLQRRIIAVARIMDKPVNVATNLLESMIKNEVPTRAEVNDIVSTILMGADGLVLAAETAIGKYPIHSVKMVRDIIHLCNKWTTNTNISEILQM